MKIEIDISSPQAFEKCNGVVNINPDFRGRNKSRGILCGKPAQVRVDDLPLCCAHFGAYIIKSIIE